MAFKRFKREYRNFKRTGKVFNLDTTRSVGIIYVADNEETVSIIKKYVKYLKEDEGIKNIRTIGYYKRKEKKTPSFLTVRLEFDFLTRKDHIRNYRPTGNIAKNFAAEEFDVLLDFTFDKELPLLHLLNQSNARFKVGVHASDCVPYYDLMIINPANRSMTDLIDTMNTILKKINKPHEA
ncbi:MAG: DUF6913 domain-containing protein [Flavobacteriales bacterium]